MSSLFLGQGASSGPRRALVAPVRGGRNMNAAQLKTSSVVIASSLFVALVPGDTGAQTQQMPTGAFCGISGPTPGTICDVSTSVCGYAAAKSICVNVCNTTTAHMCTTSEIALNAQN